MTTFSGLDHPMTVSIRLAPTTTFSSLDHPMTMTRSLDHPMTDQEI